MLKIPMALHVNMGVLFIDFDSDDNYRVFYSVEYKSPRLKSYITVSCNFFYKYVETNCSCWRAFEISLILPIFWFLLESQQDRALQNIFTIFSHRICGDCDLIFTQTLITVSGYSNISLHFHCELMICPRKNVDIITPHKL